MPAKARERISEKIDGLAQQPRPPGVTKVEGEDRLYRIRIGAYRVIYTIQDQQLLVLVVHIGDRKEIYRNLKR